MIPEHLKHVVCGGVCVNCRKKGEALEKPCSKAPNDLKQMIPPNHDTDNFGGD